MSTESELPDEATIQDRRELLAAALFGFLRNAIETDPGVSEARRTEELDERLRTLVPSMRKDRPIGKVVRDLGPNERCKPGETILEVAITTPQPPRPSAHPAPSHPPEH